MAVNTSASPALRPTPGGVIEPTRQAEYPIRLGDKLAGSHSSKDSRFVALRYNYRPKHTSNQRSKIVREPSSLTTLNLTLEDTPNDTSPPITYKYSGSVNPKSKMSEKLVSTLALVFDISTGEFVAEPVSSELNFNITSGPGQNARSHGQLDTIDDRSPRSGPEKDRDDLFGGIGDISDSEPPEKSNPYHYRHFLGQTKEQAKCNAVMTPSMTPLSELEGSSPVPQKSGFVTTAKPKTLSNASTTATASSSIIKPRSKPARSQPNGKPPTKKHRSAASAPITTSSSASPSPPATRHSPNIVVSPAPPPSARAADPDPDDLVIDMGSPPPPRRIRHQLDPSAFASASHSPDVRVGTGGGRDADSDVESLALPSPTAPPSTTAGGIVGLVVSSGGVGEDQEMEEEDEVDEDIMKEVEDILDEDDDEDEDVQDVVPPPPAPMEEEESEVSEEE